MEAGKYLVFANTDIGQFFGSRPSLEGMSLPFSLMMLVLYLALYLFSAWSVSLRRDVSV